jgi:predicted nucleic acid-binding protein
LIVVDTSVWIDYVNGRRESHVELAAMIEADVGIALTDVILTEVLQGVRDERIGADRSSPLTAGWPRHPAQTLVSAPHAASE